ncbi:MAG: pilus assembly protein HicB [Candidatus Hydrogenedentes bacterium]|nr:pilus assembly protein HicB [Candidatus Hydrogenedentota bacterium]
MKQGDQYHKWVEWSDEDNTYIGYCPDVISGIHGHDPVQLYGELCDIVEEVLDHLRTDGRPLPPKRTRPMQDVV